MSVNSSTTERSDGLAPNSSRPVLVSHLLCPYVQRAAIVLSEKGVPFERRDIDLAAKPEWFTRVSPTGKTPMLLVHGHALFESAVICEYLDETTVPRLHPANALRRAKHRGWMEFGPGVSSLIGSFYAAPDDATLEQRAREVHSRFRRLEEVVGQAPYFHGAFSLVDAVFARFSVVFRSLRPSRNSASSTVFRRASAWRAALAERPSVRKAAHPRYDELLREFLVKRNGLVEADGGSSSRLMYGRRVSLLVEAR